MNWREEKYAALQQARCVVVKVGSAVLTNAQGLDATAITSLAAQLVALRRMPDGGQRKVVLVSSGAVAAGRAVLRAGGIAFGADLASRQGAAAVGQSRLMECYDSTLAAHKVVTAQVLLTREDLRSRQRFLNARNTFAALLDWGVLPIVNENDTVSVQELKFGDNDCLASLLVNLVEADLCINLTSAPGVFGKNPQTNPDARILPCIEDVAALELETLCGGKTSVGTGGMYSKMLAARRVAQLGVPTLVLPGRVSGIVNTAMAETPTDVPVGTWVRPQGHAISRRKFWLAYQSEPVGTVCVDAGAARALTESGSSLLPGGVCAVQGNYQRLGQVRIAAGDGDTGKSLGVGLSNYSAAELKRIMGLKRHEVAAALGDAHYPEVIHRDNMVLDAVV